VTLAATRADIPYLERIAFALASARVRYCQWKGHFKQARWMSGAGDIDLLVERKSFGRFTAVLSELGLKRTTTDSFWGYDTTTGTLFHIHATTRVLVSDAVGNTYRLPLEDALLVSRRGDTFPLPPPAVELLAFVVRATLRHSWRDMRPDGLGSWLPIARAELAHLETRVAAAGSDVHAVRHLELSVIDAALFDACRDALQPGVPLRRRLAVRRVLTRRLDSARQPVMFTALVRRAAGWIARRFGAPDRGNPAALAGGGKVIALSGTDGSGKSTCVAKLTSWLRPHFRIMTAHVGRPPRSLPTFVAAALLRVAPIPLFEWTWHLCIARDRYRLTSRAWHFALEGGIALTERYPMGPNRALVGPRVRELAVRAGRQSSGLARRLAALEESYYGRIPQPDQVFVLDVDPEVAVRRKIDEPSDYVRTRAETMRRADWRGTTARHLDAGRPLPIVVAELQELVWETL
jgi:thymidylate kinase